MGVVMKGGTSGCRHDYLPNISGSANQPVLDTAGGSVPSTVHFTTREDIFPMPAGGSIPEGSTDVAEHGVPSPSPSANPTDIFRGAPNTGLKGGPA